MSHTTLSLIAITVTLIFAWAHGYVMGFLTREAKIKKVKMKWRVKK